jgi:hypothetical protein
MWSAQWTTRVSLPARPVEFMANPADVSTRLFGSTVCAVRSLAVATGQYLGGWRIEASITAPRENPTPAARQAAANPSVAPAESERIDTCAASGSLGSGR